MEKSIEGTEMKLKITVYTTKNKTKMSLVEVGGVNAQRIVQHSIIQHLHCSWGPPWTPHLRISPIYAEYLVIDFVSVQGPAVYYHGLYKL